MNKILLDTNAYIAFKVGDKEILQILQRADVIGMSVVVLAELISGFTSGRKSQKHLEELDAFLNTPRVQVLPNDSGTAHYVAQIYSTLKKQKKIIPINDLWIAASALQHGCKLCTYDKHFKLIDNLICVTTVTEFLL